MSAASASFERIPDELKTRPQWVGYKLEPRDGKLAKEPYQVKGDRRGRKAQTNNPATWGTFDEALSNHSSTPRAASRESAMSSRKTIRSSASTSTIA